MKWYYLLAVVLVLLPFVLAAEGPESARERDLAVVVAEESEKNREQITGFGEETYRLYLQEKDSLLSEFNKMATTFKVTVFIVNFSSIFAALTVHDILSRRRDRKARALYDSLKKNIRVEASERAQERFGQNAEPPAYDTVVERPKSWFQVSGKRWFLFGLFFILVAAALILYAIHYFGVRQLW